MKPSLSFLILINIALLASTGCSWFGKDDVEKPAQELIQDGIQAYDGGQYKSAIKNFEQFRDWYPFSKYAILAELKIADAHYHLEQFEEAVIAYQEFEQLHPRNEAIPYVVYQIGRSYFDQIDTVDRDQTGAQKALDTFKRLIKQFPDDPYAQKARTHIVVCLQSLAGHELYVGLFYYKSKRYRAALQRFLAVVRKYPDTGVHHQALQYIANCEALIQQKEAAVQ